MRALRYCAAKKRDVMPTFAPQSTTTRTFSGGNIDGGMK
jgi:hypothetical protein